MPLSFRPRRTPRDVRGLCYKSLMPKKTKKPAPSGVTIRRNRNGTIVVKSVGPNGPDLRKVLPQLLGK